MNKNGMVPIAPVRRNPMTNDIILEEAPVLSRAETAKIIADQNDRFRRAAFGIAEQAPIPSGQVMMTAGVSDRDESFRAALIHAVVAYDDFNTDCDPHGWHEMGVMEIEGETVWFKMDGVDAPSHSGIAMCQTGFVRSQLN
jgi:hypothetical protein